MSYRCIPFYKHLFTCMICVICVICVICMICVAYTICVIHVYRTRMYMHASSFTYVFILVYSLSIYPAKRRVETKKHINMMGQLDSELA